MQPNSIHNPAHTENAQTQNPFPTSGDNFTTVACLDGVIDPMALLTAIDFVNDCAVALAAFEQEEKRTGTPEMP
jgi:hypothetical protein